MSSIINTVTLDRTMDSMKEPFSTQLIKACHCDVMLFEEVIQRYVSLINDKEKEKYQTIINAQKEERSKMPYTLDSYNAQCQL